MSILSLKPDNNCPAAAASLRCSLARRLQTVAQRAAGAAARSAATAERYARSGVGVRVAEAATLPSDEAPPATTRPRPAR